MKLISKKQITKKVSYFGHSITVPSWTTFLITNSDRELWAFEKKPKFNERGIVRRFGNYEHIGSFDLQGTPYRNSIKQYDDDCERNWRK